MTGEHVNVQLFLKENIQVYCLKKLRICTKLSLHDFAGFHLGFRIYYSVSYVYWQHCPNFEDDLKIMEDSLKSRKITKIPKSKVEKNLSHFQEHNLTLQIMDRMIWKWFRWPVNQVTWPGNLWGWYEIHREHPDSLYQMTKSVLELSLCSNRIT